jgi:ABC-type transport system involved in cytochrome c biogenesis permease subunit
MKRHVIHAIGAVLLASGLLLVAGCGKPGEPLPPSKPAAKLDAKLNWRRARLIAVQSEGRYKTLDTFARETILHLYGQEHLPGLSPIGSLFELLFNAEAYAKTPLVNIKDPGVLVEITAGMSDDQRLRITTTKRLTLNELADNRIRRVLSDMASQPIKRAAANRAFEALSAAQTTVDELTIVPTPRADRLAVWWPPTATLANLTDAQLSELGLTRGNLPHAAHTAVPDLSPEQALTIAVSWQLLEAGWRKGDAEAVQKYVDRLSEALPALAAPGVYPTLSQRVAEARYYRMNKFTWGWIIYFLAFLFSVPALVTRWRWPWLTTLVLIVVALAIHAYGVSLRWYILGRIPVANMFEAVVFSAWVGVGAALLVELVYRTRVFLVGAAATGFMALVLAQVTLPGGDLSVMRSILDHVQLRLHTVLIIASYAMIFLAAIIALIYLIGYGLWKLGVVIETAAAPVIAGPLNVSPQRPLLAGGAPGDDNRTDALPRWLQDVDWSHLIILNMVFIMLFLGGIVLGAMWANDSWGRPWGWDPKEVFALTTWLIYAIILHVRFVVKNRGLWTAVLSLIGCTMMAINWFYVNFYINSVHSYA